MKKERFDPYYNNYALLAIDAAIQIDNMPRDPCYRTDKVRELGELLSEAVQNSKQNPNLGFYTLFHFRDAFQEPLEQAGYKLGQHTQVEPFIQDLLTGIAQTARDLKRFAYGENKEDAQRLMGFCNSLCKKLSYIRYSEASRLAA